MLHRQVVGSDYQRLAYIIMEQKKIDHITLNPIVFGTLVIIGILARRTVLHYGWDEFSSNLIFIVCSAIMGAIYLIFQIALYQYYQTLSIASQ